MFKFESEWGLVFSLFRFTFSSLLLLLKNFFYFGENLGEILSLTIIFKYKHILEVLKQTDQAKKPYSWH